MNWCILTSILVGAICALSGYMLGKKLGKTNHDQCNDRIRRLENSLEFSKKAKVKLDAKLRLVKSSEKDLNSSVESQ